MKKSLWLAVLLLGTSSAPLSGLQEEHGAGAGPLTVEGGLMFWTILVFVALLAILRKFAWPQILGAVQARERALEQQLAEAERNRAESARLLEEHRKLVADARAEAQALIAQARSAGEKERAALLEHARQEHEELLARARKEIAVERERAVQELRREAVDLSLAAAAKLVGQRFSSDADRDLVERYLGSLEAQR